jgi:signal transduction histidine kinase
MKLRIFKKLFFTTALVLFVTLTLVFVFLSIAINDEFSKKDYDILKKSCDTVSDIFMQSDGEDFERTAFSVRTVSQVNKLDLYIADNNGQIFICCCDEYFTNRSCTHTNTILSADFLRNVGLESRFELSSIGGLYEKLNYSSSKKIQIGGDNFYVISVSPVLSVSELIKMMFGMYAISALFPLLFMFVAQYSIVYRLTRPLKYMSIAAKSIANGDFSKRVPVMSNDEIGELSVLFNKMTDSLSRTEKTGRSFVANVSHELKTPMTTISGFIDGIIDGTIDDSKSEYYLKIVSDEVKRLSRLVQSMLNLARLESGENPLKYTQFRLSDTVLSVAISMEQRITESEINICGLDTLTETVIYGDADMLHQVIYNLTENAVKFTPPNGNIEIALHRFEDSVEFKIRNTGTGIPQKDIPHIFERFYKIDKSNLSVSLSNNTCHCEACKASRGNPFLLAKTGGFADADRHVASLLAMTA